jgi:hypothetical protein
LQSAVAANVVELAAMVFVQLLQKGLQYQKLFKTMFYGNMLTDPSFSLWICANLPVATFLILNKAELFCRYL